RPSGQRTEHHQPADPGDRAGRAARFPQFQYTYADRYRQPGRRGAAVRLRAVAVCRRARTRPGATALRRSPRRISPEMIAPLRHTRRVLPILLLLGAAGCADLLTKAPLPLYR